MYAQYGILKHNNLYTYGSNLHRQKFNYICSQIGLQITSLILVDIYISTKKDFWCAPIQVKDFHLAMNLEMIQD